MVDEACANVRVQLDSQPKEIDTLERKRIQLEVELHLIKQIIRFQFSTIVVMVDSRENSQNKSI